MLKLRPVSMGRKAVSRARRIAVPKSKAGYLKGKNSAFLLEFRRNGLLIIKPPARLAQLARN